MIAQALAAAHPDHVSGLILVGTQAGTGASLPIPASAAAAPASSNPATVLSVLFPPDQADAARAYLAGIVQYQGYYGAPAPVSRRGARLLVPGRRAVPPGGRAVPALTALATPEHARALRESPASVLNENEDQPERRRGSP
jgi:pimeloyl-ACP methyl ester carboxylesterase